VKELSQKYNVNPKDFGGKLNGPKNRQHANSNSPPSHVFNDPNTSKSLEKLSELERGYVMGLVQNATDHYGNISGIRGAISSNFKGFLDPEDPDYSPDLTILKRLFSTGGYY
jgi:hypothetical protein